MNKINERIPKIGEDFQEEFVTSAGHLCRVQCYRIRIDFQPYEGDSYQVS